MEDPSKDEAEQNFLLIWARNDLAEPLPMQINNLGMLERDVNTYYLRNYI